MIEHLLNQIKTYPLEIRISPSQVTKGEGCGEDMCMETESATTGEQSTACPRLPLQPGLSHQILPALALHL
jgi:hypothetical protein